MVHMRIGLYVSGKVGQPAVESQQPRQSGFSALHQSLVKHILLDSISKYLKSKRIIKDAFLESELCLTSWIAFSDEVTGYMVEGRAPDTDYLDVWKGFWQDLSQHSCLEAVEGMGLKNSQPDGLKVA